MNLASSQLILKSGQTFSGYSPQYSRGNFYGEVVFTTGMTGYAETLTDPSYKDQIIVFTYPLIGNYGVPKPSLWESKKIHASGVVVSEACEQFSHSSAIKSLFDWLKEQKVPVITGVDTRALTKYLRERGVVAGAIVTKPYPTLSLKGEGSRPLPFSRGRQRVGLAFPNYSDLNPVAEVTISKKKVYGKGKKKIIAVDCGMKENIIRSLQKFPLTIERVPYDYDYSNEKWDGVFLSNGPGDPERCTATIAILKKAIKRKKPIFGICLGSQIMSLAGGAKTYKLPFGHRGQNQPCLEDKTGRCFITSQNHGYAVEEKTLPKDWQVTFHNLNDGSIEGVAHRSLPFFSVQFHPEASPGPVDTEYLFEEFYKLL